LAAFAACRLLAAFFATFIGSMGVLSGIGAPSLIAGKILLSNESRRVGKGARCEVFVTLSTLPARAVPTRSILSKQTDRVRTGAAKRM
jgi:hypothetical protein